MQSHQLQLRKDGCNRFTVNREELWCDSIVLFKSPDFCVEHPLRIRFQGEAGVDAGGLSRDMQPFFGMLFFQQKHAFLKGKVTGDFLCTMVMLCYTVGNMFVLAGKMVSYLISHYDVGFPCLTRTYVPVI